MQTRKNSPIRHTPEVESPKAETLCETLWTNGLENLHHTISPRFF